MSTSLMPMDPALSPQQVTRLLPIRADLLPDEITSRRKAHRMRTVVIAGVAAVIVALGGWSAAAYHDHSAAQDDLNAVNKAINDVNTTMNDAKHSQITETINENKAISNELKTLMAHDLRWSTLLNKVRATGASSNVQIARITAALADSSTSTSTGGSVADPSAVATLTLEGSAKDKKTIAGFIQNLAALPLVSNPYLTSATQATTGQTTSYTFTISADVTSAALCGRFTTPCKSGGN